jgi:hypothetical protein
LKPQESLILHSTAITSKKEPFRRPNNNARA